MFLHVGVHNPNKEFKLDLGIYCIDLSSQLESLWAISHKVFSPQSKSLLEIKATLPAEETATYPAFDNQLYLFELCGLLLSSKSAKSFTCEENS